VATVILPTLDVAETPVKGTPISIFNDPTVEVAETPVSPIVGFEEIVTLPSAVVAETPVSMVVLSDTAVGVPRADVAETPVKGTPSSIFNDPTVEVAD
jgi:hypothetical protein